MKARKRNPLVQGAQNWLVDEMNNKAWYVFI